MQDDALADLVMANSQQVSGLTTKIEDGKQRQVALCSEADLLEGIHAKCKDSFQSAQAQGRKMKDQVDISC